MQPEISALDRFFIRFATSPGLRLLAWAVVIGLLALLRNPLLGWLLLVPLFLHGYGIWVLRNTHALLTKKLADALLLAGRKHCNLLADDPLFALQKTSGSIERPLLRCLPDTLELTIVAPLENYALISRHSGTIFPPRWLHPLEFHHKNCNQTEIYYADVNYVEYESNVLTLHFSNGKTFEISGNDSAEDAVTALRTRLREHKSLGSL